MITTLSRSADSPQAGWFEDQEEEDNERGFERDETDNRLLPVASGSEPAPDLPPLPKREPGKTLTVAVALTPDQRLGSYLRRVVAETDARIPAEGRAPRTLQEMRDRIEAVLEADSEMDKAPLRVRPGGTR